MGHLKWKIVWQISRGEPRLWVTLGELPTPGPSPVGLMALGSVETVPSGQARQEYAAWSDSIVRADEGAGRETSSGIKPLGAIFR